MLFFPFIFKRTCNLICSYVPSEAASHQSVRLCWKTFPLLTGLTGFSHLKWILCIALKHMQSDSLGNKGIPCSVPVIMFCFDLKSRTIQIYFFYLHFFIDLKNTKQSPKIFSHTKKAEVINNGYVVLLVGIR